MEIRNTIQIKNRQKRNIKPAIKDNEINKTLKGVLINNHIKKNEEENKFSFNDIEDTLLIHNGYYEIPKAEKADRSESGFNINKALVPLIAGTGLLIAGCYGLSLVLKKSSEQILKTKSYEQLPDLAVNMNIKQEPQFAVYRALRDPNLKNIYGAIAVFIMSGITIASKNFVDGIKEIWLKKKSADIEKNLQENLIEVETNSFSGKLNVINEMLRENLEYFDKIINQGGRQKPKSNIFSEIISFKGEKEKNNNQEEKRKNLKYTGITLAIAIAAILIGKRSISNIIKTTKNTNELANNIAQSTIDKINIKAEQGRKEDIPEIINYLKSICAKPEYIKEVGKKYNMTEEQITQIIKEAESVKKTIFSDAPTALGGIPKKIQYYCYIDEDRGHLYNWILNPENKFTKYLFYAFTTVSAIGYIFKQSLDAIKEAAVMKENAKTELDLRKRLVDVEIRNFKSKKQSALQPLIENFYKQAAGGQRTKEELKEAADNILNETKNGPPYVYT